MKKYFIKFIFLISFLFCMTYGCSGTITKKKEVQDVPSEPIVSTDNFFSIRALNGKCLDVHYADYISKINGAKVQSWDCLGGINQQWEFVGTQIKSRNGMCLDLDGNNTANGTKIRLWNCNGAVNQQWFYENNQFKAQNGLCLDLDGNKFDNGAKIQAWECNNFANQQWMTNPFESLDTLIARYKPTYHFAKQIASMPFDPNGALYVNGEYHLMYIFQGRERGSSGEVSDGHQYGHATTTDLFHWQDQPAALTDGRNFSGNAFLDKSGKPVIIYHMTGVGNSIAVSKDNDMILWEKPQKYSPLKTIVPPNDAPNWGKFDSWDPHGWLENNTYYSIFGGAQPALFKSDDMETWVYQGPFIDTKWRNGGDMSCPKFFPLGDRYVFMFIAHDYGSQFVVGKWENEKFIPESHRRMNWPGGTFFAPETLVDNRGRRIMWAWVLESRGDVWGQLGVMSLPRVFTMDAEHIVHINPPSEIESLRSHHQSLNNLTLTSHKTEIIPSIKGNTLEIKLEMNLTQAAKAGIKVLQSADGREETVVSYDRKSQTLNLDVSKSSLDPMVHYGWGGGIGDNHNFNFPEQFVQSVPVKLKNDGTLSLRIFIDRSIVEVFANGTEVITARVYPTLESSKQVSLFSETGTAKISSIESWNITL